MQLSFCKRYFLRVASPPRRCRSARFLFSTFLTSRQSFRSISRNRSVTSLCTVDLLLPKCFAQSRTVAPVSRMYSAHSLARRSMYSNTSKHPRFLQWYILCRILTPYAVFRLSATSSFPEICPRTLIFSFRSVRMKLIFRQTENKK